MPIRFRCPHCSQLLGIARRKAGSQVRCPTCQREATVPTEDEASLPEMPVPQPAAVPEPRGAPPALFERDDFEAILHGSPEPSRARGPAVQTPVPVTKPQAAPPLPAAIPLPPASAWEPTVEPVPMGGLVLSPAKATILTVAVILLLAVAFALGLIVGRFVL